MESVRGRKSYLVDDEVWMSGIGVTATGMILDDLEQQLTA